MTKLMAADWIDSNLFAPPLMPPNTAVEEVRTAAVDQVFILSVPPTGVEASDEDRLNVLSVHFDPAYALKTALANDPQKRVKLPQLAKPLAGLKHWYRQFISDY